MQSLKLVVAVCALFVLINVAHGQDPQLQAAAGSARSHLQQPTVRNPNLIDQGYIDQAVQRINEVLLALPVPRAAEPASPECEMVRVCCVRRCGIFRRRYRSYWCYVRSPTPKSAEPVAVTMREGLREQLQAIVLEISGADPTNADDRDVVVQSSTDALGIIRLIQRLQL